MANEDWAAAADEQESRLSGQVNKLNIGSTAPVAEQKPATTDSSGWEENKTTAEPTKKDDTKGEADKNELKVISDTSLLSKLTRNKLVTNKNEVEIMRKLECILVVIVIILAFLFLLSHSTTHFFNNSISHKFHRFQKTVFDHNWEDIHCRRRFKNETHVDESWIKVISEQLNIKNGQAVFDSNTGCNEWLRGLRKKYPKLKIGGAHTDQYAVEYAKRVFSDTQKTFVTVLKETGKLEDVDLHTYDHAINYAGLREMPKNTQCNLVRELLRIIKPGGSIYLGHNMEESDCKVMEKYSQYVTLPGCYWSKCLQNRTDISDMYYIRESDLYGPHKDIDSCYTAVFVHKKDIINRVKDGPGEVKAKYKEHPKKFYCTSKPTGNSIVDIAKSFINKHAMGGIVHPRNLAGALLSYKNRKENKNNTII